MAGLYGLLEQQQQGLGAWSKARLNNECHTVLNLHLFLKKKTEYVKLCVFLNIPELSLSLSQEKDRKSFPRRSKASTHLVLVSALLDSTSYKTCSEESPTYPFFFRNLQIANNEVVAAPHHCHVRPNSLPWPYL